MPWADQIKQMVSDFEVDSKGQLHAMIRRLIDADSAQAICAFFGISKTMDTKEESKRLDEWFDYRIWKWTEKWGNIVVGWTQGEREEIAQRTLRAALMMIGHWYSESKIRATGTVLLIPAKEVKPATDPPRVVPIGKAVLALVVRSSKVGDLPPVSKPLSVLCALDLISNAFYFRCTPPLDADAKEKKLGLTGNAELTTAPQREHDVYLRLEIEDCDELLDAESHFALKNRLHDGPPRTIRLVRRAPLECPAEELRDFHSI